MEVNKFIQDWLMEHVLHFCPETGDSHLCHCFWM